MPVKRRVPLKVIRAINLLCRIILMSLEQKTKRILGQKSLQSRAAQLKDLMVKSVVVDPGPLLAHLEGSCISPFLLIIDLTVYFILVSLRLQVLNVRIATLFFLVNMIILGSFYLFV